MMYDELFLEQLMLQKHRTVIARITALRIDDSPIEFIEGKLTAGSVNVDGTSAVRRTCSLTMITDKVDISDYLWGLDTRFKLEVGIENDINFNYPEIIWFNQGIYIITSFSTALSVNNCTINLQGKDKMCLLNGENGGLLGFEVDFGHYEIEEADKTIKKIPYPLKDIIREAVHHYGGEPFHNIIINDLDDRGLELQEYRYDTPLYLIRKSGTSAYVQGTLHGDQNVFLNSTKITIDQLDKYDTLVGSDFSADAHALEGQKFSLLPNANELYQATKITYGQTVGYTPTEMTFTGELIAKAGESITSVLDKIKNMLGNFEYFYDLDGRFIFQEQQNYVNTTWTPLETTSDGLVYVNPESTRVQFSFYNSALFSAVNNAPNLTNLKNDYSVWGTRKSTGGQQLPIHMRYAIDQKPTEYSTIAVSEEELVKYNNKYGFNLKGQTSVTYIADNISTPTSIDGKIHCDWRELIYQMAVDYRKYNHLDNFERKVAISNPHFPSGKTGYEQYYIDMEGFWRQLYSYGEDLYVRAYYLNEESWNNNEYFVKTKDGYVKRGEEGFPDIQYMDAVKSTTIFYTLSTEFGEGGWTSKVSERPEELNFWFDLLDSQGELAEYSVSKIGSRPKVSNDNDVKAIYYRKTPEIIFSDVDTETDNTGYVQFNIGSGYKNMFSQSTQGKTAKEAIDLLLYNHAYCIENVSLTSIPVYHLEPNKRIYIEDKESGIIGEYIASRYTIPLTYNGTMSISATKAVDRII